MPLIEGDHTDETLEGGESHDQIWDAAGNDTVYGHGGDDTLNYFAIHTEWHRPEPSESDPDPLAEFVGDDDEYFGGEGNDTIYVGAGHDTIHGGGGTNRLFLYSQAAFYGEPDDDFPLYGFLQDLVVDLAAGTYAGKYRQNGFPDVILGLATGEIDGIQQITGSQFADVLRGSDGKSEWYQPGDGADNVDGRGGFDAIDFVSPFGGGHGVTVDVADGTAVDNWGNVDKFRNIEAFYGSGADDILRGDKNKQTFYGNGGSDLIDGRNGKDTVTYRFDAKSVSVNLDKGTAKDGSGGTDKLRNIEIVEGSRFGDVLIGDKARNEFHGGDGKDTILGAGGNDRLYGDAGNDQLTGANGKDRLYGGDNNDKLFGLSQNDILHGEDGKDFLQGGKGSDKLHGGDDADDLRGGEGLDFRFGGRGKDKISDTSKDFNEIDGEVGNDIIDAFGLVHGGDDNDKITGGFKLFGDDGDDTLTATIPGVTSAYGGLGADTIRAGKDKEITVSAHYAYSEVGVTVKLGPGIAKGASGDVDKLIDVSGAFGSEHDDLMIGSKKGDTLNGAFGNDDIRGGKGNDLLKGAWGKDKIDGGAGRDTIVGGPEDDILSTGGGKNDSIEGGAGNDTITAKGKSADIEGGDGRDTIIVFDTAVTAKGGGGADTFVPIANRQTVAAGKILDFKPGQDVLDIRKYIAPIKNWKDLKQNWLDDEHNGVSINAGGDDLLLVGVSKSQLSADDFLF